MKKRCILILFFFSIFLHSVSAQQVLPAITVKNLNGKIIAKKQLSGTIISLKSMVDEGIYFITLFKDNEEVVLKTKIIVN